jgi:hypothetical protein
MLLLRGNILSALKLNYINMFKGNLQTLLENYQIQLTNLNYYVLLVLIIFIQVVFGGACKTRLKIIILRYYRLQTFTSEVKYVNLVQI